jgi:hypothetical protein
MNGTELSEAEQDRLRDLLHRAADGLHVTTPPAPSHWSHPSRRRTAWFAAAALLVVAALGATWWLARPPRDHVVAGPLELQRIDPTVLEETGIWRLPENLPGYRVIGAQDGGSFDGSAADTPGVLAVDEPQDPTRWLLARASAELPEQPANARRVPLSDDVTATLVRTDESIWFQAEPAEGSSIGAVVSGSAKGIDEASLVDLLSEHVGSLESLTTAGTSTGPMTAMADEMGLDEHRMVWQEGEGGPGTANEQVQVSLKGNGDTEVTLILNRTSTPAWALPAWLTLSAELLSIRSEGTAEIGLSVRTRSDLGRNVVETTASSDGATQDPEAFLTVITDDGVTISALRSYLLDEPSDAAPLLEQQQLRIINSLRAMPQEDFLARLSEMGAEYVGPDSMVTTTTTFGPGPGG